MKESKYRIKTDFMASSRKAQIHGVIKKVTCRPGEGQHDTKYHKLLLGNFYKTNFEVSP